MTEREQIVENLLDFVADLSPFCGNHGDWMKVHAAIKYLKTQEPRVLTLEEANNREVVWAEDKSTDVVYPCLVKNNMWDSKLYRYGIQWRVWSARPTEEQRKAVKWDG